MRKILTYGLFDILTKEHIEWLRTAKAQGDYLIVAVPGDQMALEQEYFIHRPDAHRKAVLEAIRYVDEVIVQKSDEQLAADIAAHDIQQFIFHISAPIHLLARLGNMATDEGIQELTHYPPLKLIDFHQNP